MKKKWKKFKAACVFISLFNSVMYVFSILLLPVLMECIEKTTQLLNLEEEKKAIV